MWLSLIIALLTYLLSPRDTSAQRRNALVTAAAAGGVTYAVSEYTDWGQENLKPLDDTIGDFILPAKDPTATPTTTNTTANTNGWDVLKDWGPTEIVAASAGVAAVTSGNKNWLLWGGVAIGALFLLK